MALHRGLFGTREEAETEAVMGEEGDAGPEKPDIIREKPLIW